MLRNEAVASQTLCRQSCMVDQFLTALYLCFHNPINFHKIPTPLTEMQPQTMTSAQTDNRLNLIRPVSVHFLCHLA